jgi:hypothetical protein
MAFVKNANNGMLYLMLGGVYAHVQMADLFEAVLH